MHEIDLIQSELRSLFEKLPEDVIDRAVNSLNAHARVFFYAAGRSGLMLRALAMRLAQMGRCVYVVGETVTPAIEEGDLLFTASASGTTQSVCRHAETARNCGADVFVITATENSPLTAQHPADVLLPAPSKDSAVLSGQVMGSLFEQALLIFGDAVVQRMSADAVQMRRKHANLE